MAKKVALVCDSAADFPPGMVEQLCLNILPVHIFVEGKDHLHGKNISNKEVLKKLKKKKDVYTTPFYPYECTKMYDDLLKNHDEVISFFLSKELSRNFKSASAAKELMGDADARRVHIIDTGSAAVSFGLLVKKAVELLRKGVAPADLQKHLDSFKKNVFMTFTVDNLIWLKKGGRVKAFDAFIGNMLDFKPIIQLQDAKLVPVERQRGKKPALKRIVEISEETYRKLNGKCEVWMAHTGNIEEIMVTREKLAEAIGRPADTIPLAEAGATISVHTGPGSVFVSMLPQ